MKYTEILMNTQKENVFLTYCELCNCKFIVFPEYKLIFELKYCPSCLGKEN